MAKRKRHAKKNHQINKKDFPVSEMFDIGLEKITDDLIEELVKQGR